MKKKVGKVITGRLEKRLDSLNSIDDLDREDQLTLIIAEGVDRCHGAAEIAADIDECLEQLRDEGISSGFDDADIRRGLEEWLSP